MSKQDEAGLILKLYELRREEVMRKARDWYSREFQPETIADFTEALMGEHSGHMRMVVTFWDMAAALVNDGAISLELFNNVNGEHLLTFGKIEPILSEIRKILPPTFAANLEKLIDATPDGRKKTAEMRERIKQLRAIVAQRQAAAQS